MPRVLRCYIEGRGDQWEGICLDFDIAVQGHSLPEVVDELRQSVALYLEHIATLPTSEQAAFLSRKAPLVLRLRFLWYAFAWALFWRRKDDTQRHEFLMPAPA